MSVVPVLAQAGFKDVEVFGPHAEPNGDFPNVPGHVSNPENPPVFDAIIERAKAVGADVILATDPDADRLGAAAPLVRGGDWSTFTGNQLGALLTEYVLESRRAARHAFAGALRGEDAGHDRDDPPHCRCLRRAHLRQPAGGLQVDRPVHRRGRAREICTGHRGVARLSGRDLCPRQGRPRGRAAVVRVGREGEGRRPDAAREARRLVLAIRLSRGEDGLQDDARLARHATDAGPDGVHPPRAARIVGRIGGSPHSRL